MNLRQAAFAMSPQVLGGLKPFQCGFVPRSGRHTVRVLAGEAAPSRQQPSQERAAPLVVTRREVQLAALVAAGAFLAPQPAQAG